MNKRDPLTDAQQVMYEFIRDQIEWCRAPPTVREIADHCNYKSTNGVRSMLHILERKGYTYRTKGHRNIRLRRGYDLDRTARRSD